MPTSAFDAGVRHRERRLQAQGENLAAGNGPGFAGILPDESMDPFWGALHDRKDEANAAGRGYRVSTAGLGGSDMGPMASLRRAAKEPEFDATEYQMGRAALDRTLNDNFARKWGQRTALNDADRARDPNLVDYDAARAGERTDREAAASFERMEPTRNIARRETRMAAEEMLPFNTKVLEAEQRGESARVAANARVQAAEAAAGGRVGSSAMNALARAAGTQTFGDEGVTGRVNDAIGAIRPNVPGGDDGLRPLPPEWDFNLVLEEFGGNEKQADEWLRMNGYRR